MDATPDFSLSVLAGAHAGAVLALRSGRHLFGQDPEADIVLTDPSIAARQFMLDLRAEGAILEVLSGMVSVGDIPVGPDDPVVLPLPADLAVGAVRLRVEAPSPLAEAASAPVTAGARPARSPAVALAAGLFLVGLSLSVYALTGGFGTAAGAAGLDPARAGGARPGGTVEAAHFVTDRLSAAGLDAALVVHAEAGAVGVAGVVPPDKQAAWDAIQRDFDQNYGGRILLHANLTAAASARPALVPQAVWTGDNPYVVTATGERATEGTVFQDGWTLDRITPGRLILHRAGQAVALTF